MFPFVYLARKLLLVLEIEVDKQVWLFEGGEYCEEVVEEEDEDEDRHNNDNIKMNPMKNLKLVDFLISLTFFLILIFPGLQLESLPILHL